MQVTAQNKKKNRHAKCTSHNVGKLIRNQLKCSANNNRKQKTSYLHEPRPTHASPLM